MHELTGEIDSARCHLAALVVADRQDVAVLFCNHMVRRYFGSAVLGQQSDERSGRTFHDRDARHWTVRTEDEGGFVGPITLDLHHDGREFETSYQLSPSSWG